MRESFVDKVYDTYVSNDFSYGIDNLNPKREITLSKDVSIDDKIAAIYAQLNKRVEKVSKQVEDLTGEELFYKGNNASETNSGASDKHKRDTIKKLGGTGNNILEIPGLEDDDDPLALEVQLKLLEATLTANFPEPEPDDTTPYGHDGGPDTNVGPDMPDIDCSYLGDAVDSGLIASEEEQEGDDGETDEDSLEGNDFGDGQSMVSSNSAIAKMDDAMDEMLNEASKASAKNAATMANCAKAEIGFLKVILAILRVVKIFRHIMDPALSIAMEMVEMVQLAAQCWNNPTCLATIVQKVTSKVISIIIGVIGKLLAKLFELLGMDCMTSEAMDVMNEIRGALAGIGSIFSELDPVGILTELTDFKKAMEDAVIQTKKSAQEALESIKEQIKDAPNQAMQGALAALEEYDITEEDLQNAMNSDQGVKTIIRKVSIAIGDTDDLKPKVNEIKQLITTTRAAIQDVKKVKEKFNKTFVASLDDQKKLLAELDDQVIL